MVTIARFADGPGLPGGQKSPAFLSPFTVIVGGHRRWTSVFLDFCSPWCCLPLRDLETRSHTTALHQTFHLLHRSRSVLTALGTLGDCGGLSARPYGRYSHLEVMTHAHGFEMAIIHNPRTFLGQRLYDLE